MCNTYRRMGMTAISASDIHWKRKLSLAFQQRVQFELYSDDALHLLDSDLYQVAIDWSLRWNYSPKIASLSRIVFRPTEYSAPDSRGTNPISEEDSVRHSCPVAPLDNAREEGAEEINPVLAEEISRHSQFQTREGSGA